MAYYGGLQFAGASPYGYGISAFPQAQFGGNPWQFQSGISIPPELQPLSYRQPTSAQTLFSGHPQSTLFGNQVAGHSFAPTGFAQIPQYGFQAAPTGLRPVSYAGAQGPILAAPVVPTQLIQPAQARPVDIYASAASIASAASAHSIARSIAASVHSVGAGSVISTSSAVSAPQVYAAAARASRRRNTSYGRWKDSHGVVARVPQMRNRMPDPLQNPKRTSFRKWKDMQDTFVRLGLK